jgi:hypothetical protein
MLAAKLGGKAFNRRGVASVLGHHSRAALDEDTGAGQADAR